MSEPRKPSSGTGATKPSTGRRKKRHLNRKRITIFAFVMIVVLAGITTGLMLASSHGQSQGSQSTSGSSNAALFGIKTIEVQGASRYTQKQLIDTSGISVGQSLFFVNKKRAAQNILDTYPYVAKVSVSTPSLTGILITIEEEIPAGIVQSKDGWLVVGRSGKGLELLDEGSDRLAEYITLTGKTAENPAVGHMVWETRGQALLSALYAALEANSITDIRGIDFSSYTDIRLNWKDQITVKLGTDMNLEHEVSTMATTLPRVLNSRGQDARGQLDISSYSDSSTDNDMTVFTPEDLLVPDTTEPTGTGTTTTASAQ